MRKISIVVIVLILSSAAIGTYAYTSLSTTRAATINVVGDGDALLALTPTSNYAQYSSGKLELDFDLVSATGVNMDATTVCENVFSITNNGDQAVSVVLEKTGTYSNSISFGSLESGVDLTAGSSVSVSFTISTSALASGSQILSSITITATKIVV